MSPLSSLWVELVFSVLAGLGGIVVFWGLWVEKKAVKESYRNVEEFRSSKVKAERGWKILMWGVGLEIFIAMGLAAKDGWDIRQVNKAITRIDPLTLPLSDISANATIFFKSATRFGPTPTLGPQPENTL